MAEYDDLLGRAEYRELSRDELAARVQALTAELVEAREIGNWDEWACKQNQELFRQAQADRDAARAELAAANARADENARIGIDWCNRLGKAGEEIAALSARLERVRALAEKWDGEGIHSDDPLMALCDHESRAVIAQLRAALGEDA